MIKVAMIGFGGIAQGAHAPAYAQLEKQGKAKLVAACDICPERFNKKIEINIGGADTTYGETLKQYSDWQEMLEKETVDMVDICLPTFLHAEVATAVLKKGYNVLCEKPMSLSYSLCCDMVKASKESGKQLMIGQCLRFDNGYNFIKKSIVENTFGAVKAAFFQRLSSPPVWAWDNWYMDYNRSHGCILDMHIHDIDMARYLFGDPKEVSCCTTDVYSGKDVVHSRLQYEGFSVLAVGDWSLEGTKFNSDYRVQFENATVECKGGVVTVYPRGGEAYKPDIEANNLYQNEIEFFVELLSSENKNIVNPPESAATTVRLVETLISSSEQNGKFLPFAVE